MAGTLIVGRKETSTFEFPLFQLSLISSGNLEFDPLGTISTAAVLSSVSYSTVPEMQ